VVTNNKASCHHKVLEMFYKLPFLIYYQLGELGELEDLDVLVLNLVRSI